MAVTLSVELTDEQYAALAHIAVDPQDWFQGMVRLRAKNTIAEIANAKIKEMIADPSVSSIPANKEEIFTQELAAGRIKSAAQMNEEEAAAMLETIATAGDLTPQTPALDSDDIEV
jgi:hypothetical protein